MKDLLIGNLATKLMALFLAVTTWVYLHAQGTGDEEIVVEFRPRELDPAVFASAVWFDADKNPLAPGAPFRVRIRGPKGDIHSHRVRPPGTFKCEPSFDPKTLVEDHGSQTFSLERKHFSLPGGDDISVLPLPSAVLSLRYSKFRETTVDLVASKFHYDGIPAPGYKVDSITVLPPRIKVKAPADLAVELGKIDIRRVAVHGRQESIPPTKGELDPKAREKNILRVDDFNVEVKIVPDLASHLLKGLPLSKNARPEVDRRVELETTTVDVEIQGPKEVVDEAAKNEAAFAPYVVITERDLEPPSANKNISELGCHVLDPRFRGKVTVVLMPNEKPENRQVKIKVLPKNP